MKDEAVVIENGEITELDGLLKLSKPYILKKRHIQKLICQD